MMDVANMLLMFVGPVGIAFLFGIVVGWGWKPIWACKFSSSSAAPSVNQDVIVGDAELVQKAVVAVKDPDCR
nr:START domain, START-like domain protein [Tanacetum cinerariifolium]